MSSIIFQVQSTIIVGLLYYGVSQRKKAKFHAKIMTLAIIWDILLVLQIELNRGAIATAQKVTTNSALMNFHVSIAVSSVLLYFALFYLGRRLLKGDKSIKKIHLALGGLCLLLRTGTYITSYLIKN